ncbi:hypothetical protein M0P65_07975 [Candidatus Gracilibacteria bacterium]|jgi:hypothetical protein|nr:hypothetical protein [Candidatus Gracilibacteria bacterium]
MESNIYLIKNKILNHFNLVEKWWYECDFPINLLGSKINSIKNNISFEERLINDYNESYNTFTPFLIYYFELAQWVEKEFNVEIHDNEMPEFFIQFCRLIYEKINDIKLEINLQKLFSEHKNENVTINSRNDRKYTIANELKNYFLINDINWINSNETSISFQFRTIPWGDLYKNDNVSFYIHSINHQVFHDDLGSITFLTGYFK